MTRQFLLSTLFFAFSVVCNFVVSNADESSEPPLKYAVKIGEKTITVPEGETVQLDGKFQNPKITVTPQPFRVFPYGGISFKYPRSFVFEAEIEDENDKTWTLSGNDCKIMYFEMSGSLSSADFANILVNEYGPKRAKVVDAKATITLGKQELNGTSIRVTLANHEMSQDIYRIPSDDTKTKLLVIQDSLDDSGNRSKEGKRTLAEMKASFTIER